MSINFSNGGYGMMNGMGMMGGMQNSGNNILSTINSQYSCPMCYQRGVVPYNYQTYVNPLPPFANNNSFISRMIRRIFGI